MRNATYSLASQSLPCRDPLFRRLLRRLSQWQRRRAQIEALRRLDDRLLSDIGIRRDQLGKSARPARWDAPPHWTGNG